MKLLTSIAAFALLVAAPAIDSPQPPRSAAESPQIIGSARQPQRDIQQQASAAPTPSIPPVELDDELRVKQAAVIPTLLPGEPESEEAAVEFVALLPGPASDPTIDDPRNKQARIPTWLIPGPPPAPEIRDQVLTDAYPKSVVRAPGEITGAELAAQLAAQLALRRQLSAQPIGLDDPTSSPAMADGSASASPESQPALSAAERRGAPADRALSDEAR